MSTASNGSTAGTSSRPLPARRKDARAKTIDLGKQVDASIRKRVFSSGDASTAIGSTVGQLQKARNASVISEGGLSARPSAVGGRSKKEEGGQNVAVVCRVRPNLKHEANMEDGIEVIDERQMILTDGSQQKQFAVEEVFDSRDAKCTQEYFFTRVGLNMVKASLGGYNVCIFAYGHTGSGKTYTMLGDGVKMDINITGAGAGFMPRFIDMIFEEHKKESASKANSRVRYCSQYYEVYNEQIRDLLCAGADPSSRQRVVRVHPKHGVLIEGIETSVVTSPQETLDLVNFGNQMRTVATTTMNERSSRSHAIFTFRYEQICEPTAGGDSGAGGTEEPQGGSRRESTITFVDLAGREDQAASMNKEMLFREMCYINTSLFHLAHLITKLSEGKSVGNSLAEFRNSKLTLLLAQALGGNSRTGLVATLAPPRCYFADSVSTLNFAQTVKKIQTKPVVNNKSTRNVVADLEAELKKLRNELGEAKQEDESKNLELEAAQAMIEHYKQSWEEALSRSQKQGEARKRMSVKLGLTQLQEAQTDKNRIPAPFLTKLSDDPALQGCCNYFLNKRALRLGSNQDADIIIQGVGIMPNMCELRYMPDGEVLVDLLEEDSDSDTCSKDSRSNSSQASSSEVPRVLVNGIQIQSTGSKILHHGDSLLLGYAHAFRIVIPTEELVEKAGASRKDAASIAKATLANLDSSSAIAEGLDEEADGRDGQYGELHPSLKQLQLRVPVEVMQTLHKSIRLATPLIDEANEITKSVLGRGYDVKFQLQVLGGVFECDDESSELAVSVLRRHAATEAVDAQSSLKAEGVNRRMSLMPMFRATLATADEPVLSKNKDAILYIWSMEKFVQRLDVMREVFADGDDGDGDFSEVRRSLRSKPWLNPWREMSFADVKQQIEVCSQGERSERGIINRASIDTVTPESPREKPHKPARTRVRVVSSTKSSRCSSHRSSKQALHTTSTTDSTATAPAPMQEPDENGLYTGFISTGGVLHVETMPIEVAKVKCHAMPDCKGFTFEGRPTREPVLVYFKSKWDLQPNDTTQHWTSYKAEASLVSADTSPATTAARVPPILLPLTAPLGAEAALFDRLDGPDAGGGGSCSSSKRPAPQPPPPTTAQRTAPLQAAEAMSIPWGASTACTGNIVDWSLTDPDQLGGMRSRTASTGYARSHSPTRSISPTRRYVAGAVSSAASPPSPPVALANHAAFSVNLGSSAGGGETAMTHQIADTFAPEQHSVLLVHPPVRTCGDRYERPHVQSPRTPVMVALSTVGGITSNTGTRTPPAAPSTPIGGGNRQLQAIATTTVPVPVAGTVVRSISRSVSPTRVRCVSPLRTVTIRHGSPRQVLRIDTATMVTPVASVTTVVAAPMTPVTPVTPLTPMLATRTLPAPAASNAPAAPSTVVAPLVGGSDTFVAPSRTVSGRFQRLDPGEEPVTLASPAMCHRHGELGGQAVIAAVASKAGQQIPVSGSPQPSEAKLPGRSGQFAIAPNWVAGKSPRTEVRGLAPQPNSAFHDAGTAAAAGTVPVSCSPSTAATPPPAMTPPMSLLTPPSITPLASTPVEHTPRR